jgi:hypothetical protein
LVFLGEAGFFSTGAVFFKGARFFFEGHGFPEAQGIFGGEKGILALLCIKAVNYIFNHIFKEYLAILCMFYAKFIQTNRTSGMLPQTGAARPARAC